LTPELEAVMGLFRDPWHDRGLLDVRILQHNERACSVACVAMLVNAARALQDPEARFAPLSPPDLLNHVADERWMQAISPGGDGVTLAELASFVERSLNVCGFPDVDLDVVHIERATSDVRRQVGRTLAEVARCPNQFVIANFLHSVYTGDIEADEGHFALVAGYDRLARRVLVLDPDLDDYEPYWVSEEVFVDGMATHDLSALRSRGYLSIRLLLPS
jgi:hypothetical protein